MGPVKAPGCGPVANVELAIGDETSLSLDRPVPAVRTVFSVLPVGLPDRINPLSPVLSAEKSGRLAGALRWVCPVKRPAGRFI